MRRWVRAEESEEATCRHWVLDKAPLIRGASKRDIKQRTIKSADHRMSDKPISKTPAAVNYPTAYSPSTIMLGEPGIDAIVAKVARLLPGFELVSTAICDLQCLNALLQDPL